MNRRAETKRIFLIDCLVTYVVRFVPLISTYFILDFVIHDGFINFLLSWMTEKDHLGHAFPSYTHCSLEVYDQSGMSHM